MSDMRMTPDEINYLFNVATEVEQQMEDNLQAIKADTERARNEYREAKDEADKYRTEHARLRAERAEQVYNQKRQALDRQQERYDTYKHREKVSDILMIVAYVIEFVGLLVMIIILVGLFK